MDESLEPILPRDERISEIFYYFEALTTLATGRRVGRKIGVMQEVLLRKYLEQNEELRRRMYLEQFLSGYSGALHKVEFSWYAITSLADLQEGDDVPGADGLRVTAVSPDFERVTITGPGLGRGAVLTPTQPAPRKSALREHLTERGLDLRLKSIDDQAVSLDLVDRSRLLASLESKRVGAQRFSGSEQLGSGIQTIEKAKQASLVAVDLDLRHNGSVKPLQNPQTTKQLISLVALGNGVHWTVKDRAVLGTYVDFTYLVKDSAIIRYAKYVEELAGEDVDFLEYFLEYFKGMTKQLDDDFVVNDDDFDVIAPLGEERPLREVILQHIQSVNPA